MLVKPRFNLSRLSLGRRVKRLQQDAGSVMVTVLIVMLVLTVGGLSIASVALNTAGMVVGSKDRTSAQSVVDGAIASLTVDLMNGTLACAPGAPVEGTAKNGTAPGSPDYNWKLTCSTSGSVGEARLSAASNVDGEKAKREAVFTYLMNTPPSSPAAALVTKAPLNLSSLTIKAVDPSHPSTVWVVPDPGQPGDFNCNSGGAIAGSVYLPSGAVFGTGGCQVTGDIYALGDIEVGGGLKVSGDVVSETGDISFGNGAQFGKSIYASGSVTGTGVSAGQVPGNLHAGGNISLSGGHPTVTGLMTYGGTFTAGNNPHDPNSWASGGAQNVVVPPPAIPVAPAWTGYRQSDVSALSSGFTTINWTGACTHSWNHPMKEVLEGLATPTIVDTSACNIVDLPGQWIDIAIKTDIVFVGTSFNLVGQNFKSADGDPHKIWFLAPDDLVPDCSTVPPINLQGAKMDGGSGSKISGFVYSQCTVNYNNGSENWKGAIQAGKMTGMPNFWYTPIGFPGQATPSVPTPGGSPGGGIPTLGSFTLISSQDLPVT